MPHHSLWAQQIFMISRFTFPRPGRGSRCKWRCSLCSCSSSWWRSFRGHSNHWHHPCCWLQFLMVGGGEKTCMCVCIIYIYVCVCVDSNDICDILWQYSFITISIKQSQLLPGHEATSEELQQKGLPSAGPTYQAGPMGFCVNNRFQVTHIFMEYFWNLH